jgi:hypothetical protein
VVLLFFFFLKPLCPILIASVIWIIHSLTCSSKSFFGCPGPTGTELSPCSHRTLSVPRNPRTPNRNTAVRQHSLETSAHTKPQDGQPRTAELAAFSQGCISGPDGGSSGHQGFENCGYHSSQDSSFGISMAVSQESLGTVETPGGAGMLV